MPMLWLKVDGDVQVRWVSPKLGWLKLNSDVAIRPNRSIIAISVRDSHSSLWHTWNDLMLWTLLLVRPVPWLRRCPCSSVEVD